MNIQSVRNHFFHRQVEGKQAAEKHEIRRIRGGNRKRAGDYSKQESKKQQTTQREGQFTSSSGVLPVINLLAARLSDIISRKLDAWLITLNEPISHPFGPLSNSFLCRRGCWETQTWFFTFVIDHFTVYQNYYCIIWQVPYFKNMYHSRLFNNVV